MWVIEMGNIAPRVGIKPKSLAFPANVLTIIPSRLPMSLSYPHLLVNIWLFA